MADPNDAGYTISTDVLASGLGMPAQGQIPMSAGAPPMGGTGVPNVGDAAQKLINNLQSLIGQRKQVMFPQQLPPRQVQAGDVSGNYVNPSTIGGPKHNARVTMAQNIGNLIAGVENRAEQKKARDIAFDVQRMETALNNPTPENIALVNEIMLNPNGTLSKRGKAIQEALNFSLFGDKKEDNVIKQARNIILHGGRQQQQPQPPQQGAPPQQMPQPQQMPPQQQSMSQPQQIPQARPNMQPSTVGAGGQVQPGTDAFGRLSQMMPQGLQFNPEAMLQAQAVQLGLSPHADKILDYYKSEAQDITKTAIAKGLIDERKAESIRKAMSSANRDQVMMAVATLRMLEGESVARIKASAENQRSQVMKQIAVTKDATNAIIKSSQQQIDVVTKNSQTQKDIINSKNSTSEQKEAAQKQLDMNDINLEGLKTNVKQMQNEFKNLKDMGIAAVGSSGDTTGGQSDNWDTDFLNSLEKLFPEEQ